MSKRIGEEEFDVAVFDADDVTTSRAHCKAIDCRWDKTCAHTNCWDEVVYLDGYANTFNPKQKALVK